MSARLLTTAASPARSVMDEQLIPASSLLGESVRPITDDCG